MHELKFKKPPEKIPAGNHCTRHLNPGG